MMKNMTFFCPNWRDMDLRCGLYDGCWVYDEYDLAGWTQTESCGTWLNVQVVASDKRCPSRLSFGIDTLQYLYQAYRQ